MIIESVGNGAPRLVVAERSDRLAEHAFCVTLAGLVSNAFENGGRL
jgi:hypothetical protein